MIMNANFNFHFKRFRLLSYYTRPPHSTQPIKSYKCLDVQQTSKARLWQRKAHFILNISEVTCHYVGCLAKIPKYINIPVYVLSSEKT